MANDKTGTKSTISVDLKTKKSHLYLRNDEK